MSNHTGPPPPEAVKKAIGMSFVVTMSTGQFQPQLGAIDLVPYLLANVSATDINATLGKYLPPTMDPTTVLRGMNAALSTLPRDTTWRKYMIILATMLLVDILVVALRFYVRLRITPKRLRLEDWVCLSALIITGTWFSLMMVQLQWAGHHIYTLNMGEIVKNNFYSWINGLFFSTYHFFVKSAFLVFYYRLYPNPIYRRAVLAVGAYVFLLCFIPFMIIAVGCRPLDYWNRPLNAKCWDRVKVLSFLAIGLIIADFLILSLPVPVVMRLKLKLKDRILLVGIFSLGAFISITSIERLIAMRIWLKQADFPYAFGPHMMWASIEAMVSLVVVCAPAIKSGISHMLGGNSSGDGPLPQGFSKWSFTPGGMFKRSRRSVAATTEQRERTAHRGDVSIIEELEITPSGESGMGGSSSGRSTEKVEGYALQETPEAISSRGSDSV